MSTTVDKRAKRKPRQSAAETRTQIMHAARYAFSRGGYDAVGIREIAAKAEVDPAIVIRLFGTKATLFEEVASAVFEDEPIFQGAVDSLAQRIAQHLMAPITASDHDFDDFQFLLRSATSTIAAPILSAALHRRLIVPLSEHLGKRDALIRATLVTSQILGFSTLRFALGSTVIENANAAGVTRRLTAALQTLIDPS